MNDATNDAMNDTVFQTAYKTYINHTDAGGIVYHANYLTFYENCRSDWFTSLGFTDYSLATEHEAGHTITYYPVISSANVRYFRPIFAGVEIITTIEKVTLKPASIVFEQAIYGAEDKTKLSASEITVACVEQDVDDSTGVKKLKPAKLPAVLVEKLQAHLPNSNE